MSIEEPASVGIPKTKLLRQTESDEIAERTAQAAKRITSALKDPNAETIHLTDDEAPSGAAGRVTVKRSMLDVPPPMKPNHGSRESAGVAALAIGRFRRDEIGVKNATKPRDWDDCVSYVECSDSQCAGPAIWIIGDPTGVLTEDNWHATYKSLGSMWPPERIPHCQCCDAMGRPRRSARGIFQISVGHPNSEIPVGLTPNIRYVRTLTRAEFEENVTAKGGPSFDEVRPPVKK